MTTSSQVFPLRRSGGAAAAPAGASARSQRAVAALFICLSLASCTSFSNYVSDNWPTWAGGKPKDVPPRPGEPGYAEFVAHGKAAQSPPDANAAPVATPVAAAPAAAPPPASGNLNVPAPPPGSPHPDDGAAVQGGLY
ncbi:MAG TPA: hypothetical protein VEJ37_10035 [Xanthobacteraceae bacterium]|nr:hypothetical protein [Xanthobacteraceae bacterium]